jgi:hypothetical protein
MEMKFFALLVGLCMTVLLQAQKITGEAIFVLNGERFSNSKLVFNAGTGDWFATPNDAHVTLTLETSYDGRRLFVDLEWDGKEEPHIINTEVMHNGRATGNFLMRMDDKESYGDGLNSNTSEDDQLQIIMEQIDDMNLVASISGTITEDRKKVKVSGKMNLKKTVPSKKIVTASYKTYDNVVHDKLFMAEDRSPTEAERKFDLAVRQMISESFEKVIEEFTNKNWVLEKETPVHEIYGIYRGTEKNFYDMSVSTGGNFDIHLQLDPQSDQGRNWRQRYDSLNEEFQKDPFKKGNMDRATLFGKEMHGATDISIEILINSFNAARNNFSTMHQVNMMQPGVVTVYLQDAQAGTGGGKDDSNPVFCVFMGNWSVPRFAKDDEGGEVFSSGASFNKSASKLSVQTISIYINCNQSLAKEILKNIDFEKLKSLYQLNS